MTTRFQSQPAQPGTIFVLMCAVALILAVTLFPYDLSFDEHHGFRNGFRLSKLIKRRGNDLLIGVDAEFGQAFKGKIDELQIYRRSLTAAEIARESRLPPGGQSAAVSSSRGGTRQDRPVDDLVAAWSFDETDGNIARDGSNNGNDGVLVNGPERIPGKSGGALRFNGAGQYVRVANSPSIDISGKDITISMWIAPEDRPDGADQVVVAKPWQRTSMEPPYYQYGVEFNATGGRSADFYFGDTSARSRGPFGIKIPVGIWSHVAFAYDGNVVRGYVDGREQLTTGIADPWEFGDLVSNLLLFMPFGFGLGGLVRGRGLPAVQSIIVVLVLGTTLSIGVEILQSWLPTRNSSFIDVASNGVGGVIGLGCYALGRSRFLSRFSRILNPGRPLPAMRTRVAVLIGYATLALGISLLLQSASRLHWDENATLILGNDEAGNKPWQGRILTMDLSDGTRVLAAYAFGAGRPATDASDRAPGLQWKGDPPLADQRDGVLLTRTAWLETPDPVANLVRAVKGTNRFTLRIRCATENPLQRGPARIVSLSRNPHNLNLVLAQDGPDLVVQLRTPVTGQNGMLPRLILPGVFHDTSLHDLLVSYDGSQLRLVVDGSPTNQFLRLGPGAVLFSYLHHLEVEEMRGYEIVYYLCVFFPLGCMLGVTTGRGGYNPVIPALMSGGTILLGAAGLEILLAMVRGGTVNLRGFLLGSAFGTAGVLIAAYSQGRRPG